MTARRRRRAPRGLVGVVGVVGLAGLAGLVGLAGLCASLGLAACSQPRCDKQVVYAAPAPDGAVIAFIYHRSCGTPAGLSTHVSLVPYQGSLHDAAGNVLVVPGDQPVKVMWQGARKLVVTGFENATFRRTQPFGAVAVEFPTVAAPEAR